MVFHRIMNMVPCAIHKDTLDSKILWTCLNITGQTKIIGMRMPMWVWGFPDSSFGKESTCNAGDHGSILGSGSSPGGGIGYPLQYFGAWPGFEPWVRKIPWRRERLPTPVFWPGEFHGVCSPWGCKESDTTEWLSLSRGYKCIKHTWNWAISTPTSTHKLEVYFCIYGNLNTCLLCCDE